MSRLDNWTEVTKGIYRYVIGANVCYEIHLINWWHETDILTANANYISLEIGIQKMLEQFLVENYC